MLTDPVASFGVYLPFASFRDSPAVHGAGPATGAESFSFWVPPCKDLVLRFALSLSEPYFQDFLYVVLPFDVAASLPALFAGRLRPPAPACPRLPLAHAGLRRPRP